MLLDAAAGPGDFAQIAPSLRLHVGDAYVSQAQAGTTTSGGVTRFEADIFLKGIDSGFATYPDFELTHEYGHIWTLKHWYMGHGTSWEQYLGKRWSTADGSLLLGQDSRLDSTYNWTTAEIVADDYRVLFGNTAARSVGFINRYIVDPRQQPGLRDWFLSTWM